MKFPEMDKNRFVLHRNPEVNLEEAEVETLLILLQNLFDLLLELGDPVSRWMFSVPDLHQRIWFVRLQLGIWIFHFLWEILLPLHWVFLRRFLMRPSFPALQRLQPLCHPSNFTAYRAYPRNIPGNTFFPRRDGVILNKWTKRDNWSFEKVLQSVFQMASSHQTRDLECFADDSSNPWNLSTVSHPDLIATIQQTYFLFTLRTALSAVPFVSDLCGVDAHWFQERSSQALPNSKELSVWLTLGFPFGSKNFCKLFYVFCEVFVLHGYDWIHWVAKSCTTTAYRWLFRDSNPSLTIGCNQITRIFGTKYDSANTSSARGPCDVGPLADLAISVFREVKKKLCSPKSTRLVGSKDGSWEELACESLCSRTLSSTRFSLNSCNHSGMSDYCLLRTCSWSSFFGFGIWFGSCNHSSGISEVYGFLRACLSTFSLDSIAGWWSEWSISWPEGVVGVEIDELEEIVDKPRTTTGTQFSVLHCIRIPFWWDAVFDRWSTCMSIHVHR